MGQGGGVGADSQYNTINAQRAAINQISSEILYSADGLGLIKKLETQFKMDMLISKEQRQSDLKFQGFDRFASVKNYWKI